MLTLRELVRDLDVRVVAGEDGLDAAVRWVHISELPDPTPWMSGGELLLCTGMGIGGEPADYLARLADHGLAGLGVGIGTDGGIDAIPPGLVAAAAERSFPLVEIPYELPFLAITEKASAAIITEQYAVMQRAMERLGGDVLASLLSRELTGDELARRLEPFGLGERVAALVVREREQAPFLQAALRAEDVPGIVTRNGEYTCALIAAPEGDDALFALAERLRVRAEDELGAGVGLGAGRACGPAELRRSFHEARCALEARSNGGGLATFSELGSAQLLLSLQDDEALTLFCDSILAPIEEAEGGYGGELMRSLEVFIEANGQWEGAARTLQCHRHTLRYRIRRVEELTGRSLDRVSDRIDFWLALRGRDLLN